MTKITHRDFFNVELDEGDYVVAAQRSNFNCYKIVKICNKQVRVRNVDTGSGMTHLRYPGDLIRMDLAAVTFRILSKGNK